MNQLDIEGTVNQIMQNNKLIEEDNPMTVDEISHQSDEDNSAEMTAEILVMSNDEQYENPQDGSLSEEENPQPQVEEELEPEPIPDPIDSVIEVAISKDDLSASVFVTPPEFGGAEATTEKIFDKLRENDVTFGIAVMTLKKIVIQKMYTQWVEVAVGKRPVDGTNGVLTIFAKQSQSTVPQQNEDGTVNYKELGVVDNVTVGTVLASATAPTEGEMGKSVRNTDILQKVGKPAKIPAGNGTVVSEDGLILSAGVNGHLEYKNNVFSIVEVFEIKGNIDTSTGNINFVGSVRVTGDVRSGFSIISGGDIKVNGMVEGATLQAEGNISVDLGINGMGNGKIFAKGEVKSKFIESCEVQTGGSLYAESIINSDVKCDGELIMSKGKGSLIGGTAVVAKNLTAINIGSISNIATSVTLGYTSLLTEKINTSRANLARIENDILKLDQAILYLNELYMKNTITPQRYEMLKQSIYSRNFKIEEIENVKIELAAMEEKFNKPTTSILKCTGYIFPGVRINISNYVYRVTSELYKATLFLGEDGITVAQI